MVSNNECFVVSDFDYNIDYMRDLKEQWVEINGYRITTKMIFLILMKVKKWSYIELYTNGI